MFCKHQGKDYGCTGRTCRYNIAIILMIVSFFLLGHILFPHHHHFYSASCEQAQEHETCEVEIEKALLRIGSDRYEQYGSASIHENTVLPVLSLFLTVSLRPAFLPNAGHIFLFPPLVLRHPSQICHGAFSLRAPPSLSLLFMV